jgi:hypothetical protein
MSGNFGIQVSMFPLKIASLTGLARLVLPISLDLPLPDT